MQLSYNQNMPVAIPGALYDLSVHTVDAFAIEGSDISPGFGVIAGTDAGKQVKLPAVAVTAFKGIAINQAKEQSLAGSVVYTAKDTVPVLTRGRAWVPVIGAVAVGGDVYLIHTGADAGKFAGADSANQDQITNAKFLTATTGDGIAVVELR